MAYGAGRLGLVAKQGTPDDQDQDIFIIFLSHLVLLFVGWLVWSDLSALPVWHSPPYWHSAIHALGFLAFSPFSPFSAFSVRES